MGGERISAAYRTASDSCEDRGQKRRNVKGVLVEKIVPQSNEVLKFRLIGGVELVETIKEKGRCGSNEMS